MTDLVWYASYGSNLDQRRFMCYIGGGQPEGSSESEVGCRIQTPPLETRPVTIPYPLYFAGESSRWGGGVAFIGHQRQDRPSHTLGRMYLITVEQFIDVVSQENRGVEIKVELQQIHAAGKQQLMESDYGTIVSLGTDKGIPVFTFTSHLDLDTQPSTAPSSSYLGTIVAGLLQTYQVKNEELIDYLLEKPGVSLQWSRESLKQLIESRRK